MPGSRVKRYCSTDTWFARAAALRRNSLSVSVSLRRVLSVVISPALQASRSSSFEDISSYGELFGLFVGSPFGCWLGINVIRL